jgi:hypothetical protein
VNDIGSVGGGVDPRRGAGEMDGREADRPLAWIVTHLLPVALAGVFVLFGAKILLERWLLFDRMGLIGVDLEIYLGYARRFLDTGSMYAATQLAGPYPGQPYVSGPIPADMPSLYPPTTIYLFAPFLVLPPILWWVIPLGVVAYVLLHLRPARATWPVIVLPLITPDFAAGLVTGNTGMWLLAGVAGGVVWGWPAVILLIKPFLAPFALSGARMRAWWIGLAVAAALSVPLTASWIAYPTVVANARGIDYWPLGYVPMLLAPIVAWIGRDRTQSEVEVGRP